MRSVMYLHRKFLKRELLPKLNLAYKGMFTKILEKININKDFIPSLVVSLRWNSSPSKQRSTTWMYLSFVENVMCQNVPQKFYSLTPLRLFLHIKEWFMQRKFII